MSKLESGLAYRLQMMALKAMTPKNIRFSELYFLEAARRVRAAVGCGLGYVGGVLSMDNAQQVLDEGFDAVVMARALVHDPAIVNRFREDPSHHSACDSGNRCVALMYTPSGTHCALSNNVLPPEWNRVPAAEVTAC